MKDYKIEDGNIVGNDPGQFQFGQRYVKCNCGIKRPAKQLKIVKTIDGENEQIVIRCKDRQFCAKNGT